MTHWRLGPAEGNPAAPTFPLGVSANGRYLTTSDGTPLFIHGNTIWELSKNLTLAEAQTALDAVQALGFNAVIVSIPGCYYPDKSADYPNTIDDQQDEVPFTSGLTPNENYWAHVDDIMDELRNRDMVVFFSPAYLGFIDADGIRTLLASQTDGACYDYGEFIGTRYGGHGNIVWVYGGDTDPTSWASKINNVRDGIEATDSTAFHGSHWGPNVNPWDYQSALATAEATVWNAYSYTPRIQESSYDAYTYATTKPVIAYETQYENETMSSLDNTGADVIKWTYRAVLSGACGHFFGNNPLWFAGDINGGWSASLSSDGHTYEGHVTDLFNADRPWWKLVPSRDGALLKSGNGDPDADAGAQASLSPDGDYALVFFPSALTITIDMGQLDAGASVACSWFNIQTGAFTLIGTYDASGNRDFTGPGATGYVLVLETA